MDTVISPNIFVDKVTSVIRVLKKALMLSCVLSVSIMVSGCATIIHGPTQEIVITSSPPRAKVIVSDRPGAMVTPAIIRVQRKQAGMVMHIEKEGYGSVNVPLKRSLSGCIWGNCLFYGLPVAVDFSSGSAYSISPNMVHIIFQKGKAPVVTSQRYVDEEIRANMGVSGRIVGGFLGAIAWVPFVLMTGLAADTVECPQCPDFSEPAFWVTAILMEALGIGGGYRWGKEGDRMRAIKRIQSQLQSAEREEPPQVNGP